MRAPYDIPSRAPEVGELAIVGDGRSCALVSLDGAVEWLCWPRFDSPSVFASLLDRDRGGTFRLRPAADAVTTRRYLPGTNVLETTFRTAGGTLVVTDFMPVDDGRPGLDPEQELVRMARCTAGEVRLDVLYDPRPNWGRTKARVVSRGPHGWALDTDGCLLMLHLDVPLDDLGGGRLGASVRLSAGDEQFFSLTFSGEPAVLCPRGQRTRLLLDRTVASWRAWSGRTLYEGPRRDAVVRSALLLKLLAFSPTGAIIAAPTTSLPEDPSGGLTWDYRFCWLRDASLTARALFGLGHRNEAVAFVEWLLHATRLTRPRVHVLYDLYGRPPAPERELDHLEGWHGARPVRIGNAADRQHQLDVYGEVIDAAAWFVRHGERLDRDTARLLEDLGRYVRRHWTEPDAGIWELRGPPDQHTHSRVLAWTALDRLCAMHDAGILDLHDRAECADARDRIRVDIERRGYDPAIGSYVAVLDGHTLDAALLRLPLYGYVPADAPRMRSTIRAIRRGLGAGGPLLFRNRLYDEGAFGLCSFWLIEALALSGEVREAEAMFETMLSHANDVGLFAEEVDVRTGAPLGNAPQAYTHVGLVNAALTLESVKRGEAATHVSLPCLQGSG
jgi:GH15 family glucan-1,4-alpha-glucosidase